MVVLIRNVSSIRGRSIILFSCVNSLGEVNEKKLIVLQIIAKIFIFLMQGALTLSAIDIIAETSYYSFGNAVIVGILLAILKVGN